MVTTFRLWPATTPGAGVFPGQAIFGVQFSVSSNQAVYAIWHYSPATSTNLPTSVAVWDADTSTLLTENLTPTWSGAAGSGWIFTSFPGTDVLVAGVNYFVATFQATALLNWRMHTAAYWTTGAGASGITNGPLSAPGASASLIGQGVTAAGSSITLPTSSGAGQNYWCDIEVGPKALPIPAHIVTADKQLNSVTAGTAAPSASAADVQLSKVTAAQSAPFATAGNIINGSATAGNLN